MYELTVASKYLLPRWRQLSVSIISLVSTLVIALVVWLIVVFFSVKDGLETGWMERIIALTAPVRVTPTEKYYNSYYYLADTISANSDYTVKNIAEKANALSSDPYDPEVDEEIPSNWPSKDLSSDGKLKDLVKEVYLSTQDLNGLKNLNITDYENTAAMLHLTLSGKDQTPPRSLEHGVYLGSLDTESKAMAKVLLAPSDLEHQFIVRKNPSADNLFAKTSEDKTSIILPPNLPQDPILLPKAFKEAGVMVGDKGFFTFYSPTPSTVQEQRLPFVVTGFYDPGIIPIGSKFVLAPKRLIGAIRSSHDMNDAFLGNGINIHFDNFAEAPRVKEELLRSLKSKGIDSYWEITTYQEYEFTKDIVQQLRSEKNLFSLISMIIIIVACSNIISMLIILVNDKKLEIGILRSMGASSASIALIFGICGMFMGAIGSLLGIGAAILTLRNINELVGFISSVQGYDLFNPVFYGNILPGELSTEALSYVLLTTVFISLLAGIVPAIKACTMRPSAILRSE